MFIKQTVKILTSIALLTTLSMAQKEALIVGVSDYSGHRDDLGGIEHDMQKMESLFKQWGFHVVSIHNADSMNLERYLENYSSLSGDDSFIFYYSGHGYHTKDKNGDEPDGEDEALVLSDGNKNELFLDDTLFGYLNAIKAKKMVMLDSCHSGTAFKAFGDKPRPKTIGANAVNGIMKTKAFRPQESKIKDGDYIVFSASQDNEESLDTKYGGLFTTAFYHQFEGKDGANTRLTNLKMAIGEEIIQYCKNSNSTPHHPNLSVSNNGLKYTTINKFFQTKSTPTTTRAIKIFGKKEFKEGELLSFKIDTNGNRGYLTIFSIENGEPFIMTQTPNPVNGVLNFQQNFNIQPPIECYKSCGNCEKEVSSVYIILSEKPMTKKLMQTKGLMIDSDMRAFRHKTNDSFEPIMAKVEFTIY